jgi:hypothetical protein
MIGERGFSSWLIRAFRTLCDPKGREDLDLAASDIARDVEDMRQDGYGVWTVRVLVLAKSVGTILPIARDRALRGLASGFGFRIVCESLAGAGSSVIPEIKTRTAFVLILGFSLGLTTVFLSLMIGDGLSMRVGGVIQRIPVLAQAALFAPHAVVYAVPMAILFGLLVAARRAKGHHPTPNRLVRMDRTVLVGVLLLAVLEGALLFHAVPRVNQEIMRITSTRLSDSPSQALEKGVREMSLTELVRAARDSGARGTLSRMSAYEIHMRSSFAVACIGFALLGLMVGFRGPGRMLPAYALVGLSAALWFFLLFPIHQAVSGGIPAAVVWLPTLGLFGLSGGIARFAAARS